MSTWQKIKLDTRELGSSGTRYFWARGDNISFIVRYPKNVLNKLSILFRYLSESDASPVMKVFSFSCKFIARFCACNDKSEEDG